MISYVSFDSPLRLPGHPITAASEQELLSYIRKQRRWWKADRARWRAIKPALVLGVDEAPAAIAVRTKHGEGWLHPRGDFYAVKPDTWVLVDVEARSLVEATQQEGVAAAAEFPSGSKAIVREIQRLESSKHGDVWSVHASWKSPSGLDVRVFVTIDESVDPTSLVAIGSELSDIEFENGRLVKTLAAS